MLIGFNKTFAVRDKVHMPSQGYDGEVVEVRADANEYLVRYSVPNGRRPYYETWWPADYLVKIDGVSQ